MSNMKSGLIAPIRDALDLAVTHLATMAAAIGAWNLWTRAGTQTNLANLADRVGIGTAPNAAHAILDVAGGSYGFAQRAIAADDAFAETDFVLFGTGGAGGIHATLPAAAAIDRRAHILMKVDGGAGVVGFRPTGADLINGANADLDLANIHDWGLAIATAAGWLVMLRI